MKDSLSSNDCEIDAGSYSAIDPLGIYTQALSIYKPIMTSAEVAEVLRCTPATVCKMCADGRIPNVPGSKNRPKRSVWQIPKLCVLMYLTGKEL